MSFSPTLQCCFLLLGGLLSIRAEPLFGLFTRRVKPGEYSFFVRLENVDSGMLCSGSLVSKRHVLTSAHCFKLQPNLKKIGVLLLDDAKKGVYKIESAVTYDQWSLLHREAHHFSDNDIAIAKLKEEVSEIEPATIKPIDPSQPHGVLKVVGWDIEDHEEDDATPTILKVGFLKLMKKKDCQDSIRLISNEVENLENNILCTEGFPNAVLTCGDSGGPLLDSENRIVGITDSIYCAAVENKKMSTNVHIDIKYYARFIEQTTKS
ncbi:transmembrane protease serine 11D-like [Trichogramma pretiosum]|uniref:transmembrane protease serine 11D-like n=1 Tax=Trichogramma pretiosum TaxID=7493 RepID=UPI0006C9A7D6|nr:transmembrane protease serine 11D-like [Trichogramma pretiosum]